MQKDTIIYDISSVALNPDGINDIVKIENIGKTIIDNNNETLKIDGYLDIGIHDTMKDLLVNCIGAFIFSIIGYFYLSGRNKGMFASKFIPKFNPENIIT